MAIITDKTITSKYQPKSTNVFWVDTSQNPPVEKHFINGIWKPISGTGGSGATDYEDLSNKPSINGVTLNGQKTIGDIENRSADVSTGKLGYKILDSTKSFSSQITEANTIYEIRDVYDLGNSSVIIPANCILKFSGGLIKNGTISGNNTKIKAEITESFVSCSVIGDWRIDKWYPEWFGAKGDGVTDDTNAFQQLDGKQIQLSSKTYRISNVVFSKDTALVGTSITQSVIKQCDNSTGSMILLKDFCGGRICNISIEGGANYTESQDSMKIDNEVCSDALIKLIGTRYEGEGVGLNYYCCLDNIRIINAPCNGLVCLGSGVTEHEYTTTWNWLYFVRNIYVLHCKYYGIYNTSTDNRFCNLYIHHCGYANIVESGSSNIWDTIKADGISGAGLEQELIVENDEENSLNTLLSSKTKGALLIIRGASTCVFNNIDLQSSAVAGIKILRGASLYSTPVGNTINLSVNNCGCAKSLDYNLRKKYTPGVYCEEIIGSKINIVSINGTNQVTSFICPTPQNVANNEITIIESGGTKRVIDIEQAGNQFDLAGNNIINSGINVGKQQTSVVRNLIPQNLHNCEDITTTGVKSQSSIFDGYTDVLLDYQESDKTCYTGMINANKGSHVYLAIAVVKIDRTSNLMQNDDSILKLPYISIFGYYNNSQLSVKSTIANYSTQGVSVGDKLVISRLSQFDIDDVIKINVAISVNRSYCNGAYEITNISLYDLTECLGITEVNTRIYNQDLLYNLFRKNNLYTLLNPINTFETTFVSEFSKESRTRTSRTIDMPKLDNKYYAGSSLLNLDTNSKLYLANTPDEQPIINQVAVDGWVFIQNTLESNSLYYVTLLNSRWYTSEISFSKTNTTPTTSDLVSIYRGDGVSNLPFFSQDKNTYPYIAIWTNKTTEITFNIFCSRGKWVEYDKATAGVSRSGTFANKPQSEDIYVGFRYFCTDKQTSEGATDGIEIIHKGNNVWVDALGRVIS